MEKLFIEIPPLLKKRVKVLAAMKGLSIKDIVITAIENYLKLEEK